MKTCSKCGVLKEEPEFRKGRNGCKACETAAEARRRGDPAYRDARNAARRKKYEDPEYRETQVIAQRKKREDPDFRKYLVTAGLKSGLKRRRLINLLKMERPCYDCGGLFPPEATEWDHLPGTEKCFTIGQQQASFSLDAVIDEISKCQLVCCNCHRLRTLKRKPEEKEPKTVQQSYLRKSHRKRKSLLNLLKHDRPCYDCGGMFTPELKDWDHIPGTKKIFSLSKGYSHTLEACIDEINKCQLVCANCHRVRTESRKRKSSQVIGQEGVISES